MSVWAIGDVQGCLDPLERLLQAIGFDPARDRLWFCGDLVNRGGDSLAVLRRVKAMGDAAEVVLGNHDLHLLAEHAGAGKGDDNPEFQAIFEAPDGGELMAWLRQRPLSLLDEARGLLMVHAGLLPSWDLERTRRCAHELETALRAPDHRRFFEHMYGNRPAGWRDDLDGHARLRVITNALTRLRYLDADGHMHMKPKGPPGSQPDGLVPWFEAPGRRDLGVTVLFGHWSALGFHRGDDVIGLDTGCVWGGPLTALDLDRLDRDPVSVPRDAPRD